MFGGRRCAGKARKPFTKQRARKTVNLGNRFVGVDLTVGSQITVRVTKPGMIGAARVITMRSPHGPEDHLPLSAARVRSKLRKRC